MACQDCLERQLNFWWGGKMKTSFLVKSGQMIVGAALCATSLQALSAGPSSDNESNYGAATSQVHQVTHSLATNATYTSNAGYKWGRSTEAKTPAAHWARQAASQGESYKWGQNSEAKQLGFSNTESTAYSWGTESFADQSGYKWSIRSSADQAGYKWSIRSYADQAGYKWSIRSSADQAGYKWSIRSFADQAGYKWSIRSYADQAGYKWSIRSFADQAGYKWSIRTSADQAGYKWSIR
ncbi:hypothetical protein [Parahaliea aestuarii]|uniref:Uncharacterized protein n=1 Tax=Parahaliea aestuarii TaxID=1852021 RepID=A0A5C8ZR25_9GAMM|nr:hypothetical protein [Parahaliea aestuarii]TXS90110.1 hypothetical protein FVW59_16055 [Parahaliea aestuarii]